MNTETCITCGLPIDRVDDGTWFVVDTNTSADGLSFCPPDPDREPEGPHTPRCWNDWCVSNAHADDRHVDVTGYAWTEKHADAWCGLCTKYHALGDHIEGVRDDPQT